MMRSRLAGKPGAPPVRRLVIKPLAAPPKPPPGFEDAAWGSLSTAIDAIHDRVGLDGSNSCVGGGGPVASKNNGSDVRSKSENDSALAPSKETTHSYETLYRAVEDVCVHGKAQGLFDRLVGKLKERVDESVAKLKGTLSAGCDDETFLARFDETWTEHLQSTGMVQKIFLYLDRTFVSSRGAVHTQRTIWDVSVELFKLALVLGDTTEGGGCQTDDEKRKRAAAAAAARASGTSTTGTGVRAVHDFDACQVVTRGCLRLIKAERDGEAVDRFLLKRVSRAFVSLKIYTTKFEPDFLSHVRKHYAEEGDSLFLGGSAMSVFEYLKHAEQRLTEEAERCDACLDQRTKRGAVAVVTTELLEKHFTGCLQKGFKRAFTENRVHDLKRFYELAKRCGGGGGGGSTGVSIEGHSDSKKFTSLTRRAFADALREIGAEICSDPTRENDLVMRCLRLKSMCDFTTQNAFQNDETFVAVVRESFEKYVVSRVSQIRHTLFAHTRLTLFFYKKSFINANANAKRNRPAELLAKFIDAKMRGDKNGSGKVGVGTVSGDGPGSIPGDPSTGTSSGTEEQCLDQALMLFRHVHGKDVFEAFYKKDLAKRLLLGKSARYLNTNPHSVSLFAD
jgi:cullin-4